MKNSSIKSKSVSEILEVYLTKWKWIALGVILAALLALTYLRYATYKYQISASIKIKNNEDTESMQKLRAMQDYVLFTQGSTKVLDEIEVIKSTNIAANVAKELNLNIRYFNQGRISSTEIYKNPPINISFFENDSVIHKIDTSLILIIKPNNKFVFTNVEDEESQQTHEFGSKIATEFGDIILTPNFNNTAFAEGNSIIVKISPIKKIIENLRNDISIIPANEYSNVLKINYKNQVKEKGIDILNKLIEKYNESAVNDKLAVVKSTSDFINDRLQAVSEELSLVDLNAETVQQRNRLTDLASQSSIYLKSERETEAKLMETSTQLELVNYMKDHLDSKGGVGELIPSNVGISDQTYNETARNINELVNQRNRILKNSTEKNPTIVNLDDQIAHLRASLNQSLSNIKSSNEIRLNALNIEDQRLSGKIYSAPKKARQSKIIERQQNIKESLYLYLLEKREESTIALGITTPNAKIVDAAYSSVEPVVPRKMVTLLAALIFGGLIPIALIYAQDLMNTKVNTKADIYDIIDVPFLGDIPSSGKKSTVVKKVDYSPKAEAFRLVRTNIDFMLANHDPNRAKIIFVTSTTSQEGKSFTSINLATSISHSGKKVLIIETDIRVPKVSKYLKIKTKRKGLTDYIGNNKLKIDDVIIVDEDNPNLDVISSGTIPPNPAELLMSERMAPLFDQVSKKYEYVIVDTAAVGLVTDTLHISKHADMFVYVVRAGRLDKSQLHVAETMYTEKRLPKMAILLNDVEHKRGYGYGYGNSPGFKKKWWKFSRS